jgi:DNA polymerase-3 subunit gamma/tau
LSATTVLARKWRPKSFAQLVGQEHVVQALCNALDQNRLHHAYLFTGTRGVGKTTIARIFAKSLNCVTGVTSLPCGNCSACHDIDNGRFVDLIELDAASNTQVDNMRDLLESALYAPSSGRFKVYIIDEVHMLSKSAFNAMLKTLEEPPGHVKFVLATTDPQKIPVTVLSRCLQFNLKQLPPALITAHLKQVLEAEQIPFEAPALSLISRSAQGSMRDALSLLDQAIAYSSGRIVESLIRDMLGTIDHGYLYDLLVAIGARDGFALIRITDNLSERGISFDGVLQDLATLLHRIALAQYVEQGIPDDEPDRDRLLLLANQFSSEELHLYYQIAIHGRDEIRLAPDEYAGFSMTMLRMLAFAPASELQVAKAAMNEKASDYSSLPAAARRAGGEEGNLQTGVLVSPAKSFDAESDSENVARATTDVQSDGRPEWTVLLEKLNMQGMAQQLAKNCTLVHFSGREITLGLSEEHKHLQANRQAIGKLQTCLAEYFAIPVKLKIVVNGENVETPAVAERKNREFQRRQAEESIENDAFVRESQSQLGATLIPESIKEAN